MTDKMARHINVIGAGLAGCEASWQAARRGVRVKLFEMKPERMTPAHSYEGFAELVCSNSLRNNSIDSAIGLLKEELRRLSSLVMESADANKVSAGGALAVDRKKFSDYITAKIKNEPLIEVIEGEVDKIPHDEITVIATGPLTSDKLAAAIDDLTGKDKLSFFDAASPIVSRDSIDMSKAFFASRYGKGDADYINCPMTKDEYDAFYDALIFAEAAPVHGVDNDANINVFEGCMPVEVMATRGYDTLRFGPMKPVGIANPETKETYYAVVQLRRENEEGTMFNLVGFQTHLRFPEQKRVFSMIPGLENAEFLRYGVMHRNTFLNSPGLLGSDYGLIGSNGIYFAGQMTGVEGYIESAASGYVAGTAASCLAQGYEFSPFPRETMIGAMASYIERGGASSFQPMNANFGLISPPSEKIRGGKKMRYAYYSKRSLDLIDKISSGDVIL